MSDDSLGNAYAPPASDALEDERDQPSDASSDYYVVAPSKFYLLALSTYGLYLFYWFYAHFRAQQRSGMRTTPLLAALFNVFTVHRLFRRFDVHAREAGISRAYRASAYSGPYLVLVVAGRLVTIVMPTGIGHLIGMALFFAAVAPLGRAQLVANRLAGDEHGSSNARFSAGNLVAIGLGIAFWMLVIVGLVSAQAPPSLRF